MTTLTVNDSAQHFDGNPDMPLLWNLRDLLGHTGTKFGCGMALCGVCTVHLDGVAIRACITPFAVAAGKARDDDRGVVDGAHASAAAGTAGTERRAMRLLPVRADHAGRAAAEDESASDRRRHRRCDVRQHLPLRHLYAHIRAAIRLAVRRGGTA